MMNTIIPDAFHSATRFALGTVQFGQNYGISNRDGQVSFDEVQAIIKLSHQSGMNTLDTATAYGNSEQRLGTIGVQHWHVVSKLPAIPEQCGDICRWVFDTVGESLNRLQVKQLHGLLLHRPQQLLEQSGDQLYRALLQLKQNGLVTKIGISIYDPTELDTICSLYDIDLVQAPFNVIDRRLIESGWLFRLVSMGVELHVRSVFLQGLLLMSAISRPKKFDRWAPLWSSWDQWLNEMGITPLQACLRYVLSFKEINKVVVGVDSIRQLSEILEASVGAAQVVPSSIVGSDIDLINPANWQRLC
jgi:aryl-alcohol dehydrogenase-like predicted oxidoreductase